MLKKNQIYQSISVILLLAVIAFAGLYYTTKIPQLEKEAIVHSEIYDWGYNELDESQLLFDYWIYNYGDIEAKNLKIRCKLFDEENNVVSTSLDSFGNLASHSVQLGEFTPPRPFNMDAAGLYTPVCYVESCDDNCNILVKRIPEIVESYGII